MKFLLAALVSAWSFSTQAFTVTGDCAVASSAVPNVNVTVFPCVALNVVPVSPPLMLHFTIFPVKLAFSAGTAVNVTFPPFANGYALSPAVCSVPALILAIVAVSAGGFAVTTVNVLLAVLFVSPSTVAVTVIFSVAGVSACATANVTLFVPVDVVVFVIEPVAVAGLNPVLVFKFCSVMLQFIVFPLKLSPIGANVTSAPCCTETAVEFVSLPALMPANVTAAGGFVEPPVAAILIFCGAVNVAGLP